MKDDISVFNFDYNPDKEPPNLIEHLKRVYEAMMRHTREEEERMKSPDWEYRRIHIASREVFEVMTSPDTPLETRMQLEWATFAGYEWVRKDENTIYVDDKVQ